jgi:hypothetical protein
MLFFKSMIDQIDIINIFLKAKVQKYEYSFDGKCYKRF